MMSWNASDNCCACQFNGLSEQPQARRIGGMLPEEIAGKLASPLQLQWTVSRKCNFRCPHCFNNSGPDNRSYEAPHEAIIENIIDAKPFNVCLCGGEPFTWPYLYDLVKQLRDGGIQFLSLVTNAFEATPDRLKRVVDNGLRSVQVSCDGPTAEHHMSTRPYGDSWNRTVRTLKVLSEIEGLDRWCVSFTPTRANIESFPRYVEMMCDLGVKDVRVQPLMFSGRGADIYDTLRPTAEQYLRFQAQILALRFEKQDMRIEWGDPLEHINAYANTPVIPQFLGLNSCGWFELSPYIPVLFGDGAKHSIREFWAKGVKEMWTIPIMKLMARQLQTLDGMKSLKPRIYFEDHILIDRFNEDNWRLAQASSSVEELVADAETRGFYELLRMPN